MIPVVWYLTGIYQDTSSLDFEGNPHFSISKLEKLIKPELRNRVYCMHIDEEFNRENAKKLGFNTAYQVLISDI